MFGRLDLIQFSDFNNLETQNRAKSPRLMPIIICDDYFLVVESINFNFFSLIRLIFIKIT